MQYVKVEPNRLPTTNVSRQTQHYNTRGVADSASIQNY